MRIEVGDVPVTSGTTRVRCAKCSADLEVLDAEQGMIAGCRSGCNAGAVFEFETFRFGRRYEVDE